MQDPSPGRHPSAHARQNSRVVLIGWDAADWEIINPLLDAGLMPNLRKLIENGVMGTVETLQPVLSPILWTSIATGKTGDVHRILGFVEPDPVGGRARPVTSTSRKAKALWNILSENGLRSLVVNWFASHPAEAIDGAVVSNIVCKPTAPVHAPWPMVDASVHPTNIEEAIAELRLHPGEISGGDLLPFLPKLDEVDQKTDKHPYELAAILAETISTQAALTWLMETQEWNFAAVYFDAIDHAGHHFMRYRAPRLEIVPEREFNLYKDVMDGVYCFLDMMLGRVVQLAGADATIVLVSDHGFESGQFRPVSPEGPKKESPTGWHRSHGVLCVAGPAIRKDELIYGAGLLDIAPTILELFGLPAGSDMPGRVLAELFVEPPTGARVPTWETGKSDAPDQSESDNDAWAVSAVLAQLSDLGYIDTISQDAREGLRRIEEDRDFNLALIHMSQGNYAEAVALLEGLLQTATGESATRMRLYLAQALYKSGELARGRGVAEQALAENPGDAVANVIRGNLALAEGDYATGVECLKRAELLWKYAPRLRHVIGTAYLRSQRWDDAERCFRAVISSLPESAESYAGLARCLLEKQQYRAAASTALDAIGLRFNLPGSHFVLGVSLARLGDNERAAQALETCLKLAPGASEAREWLECLPVSK